MDVNNLKESMGKTERITLKIALLNVLLLSVGHAYNIKPLIIVSCIFFSVLVIISSKRLFLPLMLFYLPWSPIMKIAPNSYTFYTIILPFYFILFLLGLINDKSIRISYKTVFITVTIAIWTLCSKLIQSHSVQPNYFTFIGLIAYIPIYIDNYKREISFETCIIFLTAGIITACIASEKLMTIPHMSEYIVSLYLNYGKVTRASSFYKDPNYYATQILVGIGGQLILTLYNRLKKQKWSLLAGLILIYFGMLSISKMFIITLVLCLLVWFISLLSIRGKIRKKVSIIFSLIILATVILSSSIFLEQLYSYLYRFGIGDDISTLTTGRSDIIKSYLKYFSENQAEFIFGQGYTDILPNFGKATHNTILEIIYQFGLLGTPLLFVWFFHLNRALDNEKGNLNITYILVVTVLVIVCFLPWLSLHMLFYDGFFYFTALYYIGKDYVKKKETKKAVLKVSDT